MHTPLPTPCASFPLGDHRDPRATPDRFASPLTRILLAGDGLTTTLLEALAGERPRLHRVAQSHAPAAAGGPAVPPLLHVAPGTDVLVRRTALLRADGAPLSANHVVAHLGPHLPAAITACLTGDSVPLGPALNAAGAGHRRTLLDVGRRTWDARPACYKTYLVWHGDAPLALINELFHPDLVPAD
ncbi:hypothetical protein [Streptomyces sp. RFCAC02]|uniref:chorismate--pyruvate lyase family protein n=1 Tax=Streptomyces sp. RFCAC02 TaxID=2499143 RepID=UPI00101FA799|nr:hypothetical protein [Streptomyces sp. RFCAC02]